jgi:RNA polymerase sigma-70 factor, ECF subfamily
MTSVALETGDRALVRLLRVGDEAAFAQLVRRESPALLRVALSHVRTRAVAEEVVQEAWLGVLRGIGRFEGRSSLKTWIFRIAVNVAKTRAIREARSLPFSALADEPTVDPERFEHGRWRHAPTSFDRLEQRDALQCVEKTIATLPPEQRQVITLLDICGLGSIEVCDLLELTPENQRVLLHRARAKVCAALERLEIGAGGALTSAPSTTSAAKREVHEHESESGAH